MASSSSSSLRYALAIPSCGGKTTLSTLCALYLDIDNLYNLRETQATYERMNNEIRRRVDADQKVPMVVGAELRARVAQYTGPAICLLVHSVAVAEQSGLQLVGILVPKPALHETAMIKDNREEIDKWFARRNAKCLLEDGLRISARLQTYASWKEFTGLAAAALPISGALKQQGLFLSSRSVRKAPLTELVTKEEQDHDEELLISLCTTGLGCEFGG